MLQAENLPALGNIHLSVIIDQVTYSRAHISSDTAFYKILKSMKFSQKNIENWRSWKITFFLGGPFEFYFF